MSETWLNTKRYYLQIDYTAKHCYVSGANLSVSDRFRVVESQFGLRFASSNNNFKLYPN